jgi:dephospho-CoA kinase
MSIPLLIGILGRSRSGKDTVAQIIQSIVPYQYEVMRFAQPIKNALHEIYGFSIEQMEDDQKELIDSRYNITPRQAMRDMTTHYMTMHGPSFFSKNLFDIYDKNTINHGIIIPDVRYEHDIIQIQKRGGIVLKIVRPTNKIEHIWEDHINDLNSDYVINNDSDLNELRNNVLDLIESYKTGCS